MEAIRNRSLYIVLALLLPFVSGWVQWQFWSIFKPFVWFLFFPTVFFSSRIGGKAAGIASTLISALLVVYCFIPPQFSFSAKTPNNLYSVVVFLLMGVLFSYTHERLERAKRREAEAQEAARIASEQLQEGRIGRLQAEQRQTEACLLRSEEKFGKLFNNAPIAIGIGRKDDGRLVDVNDAWLQLYGFERDEAIGRTTTELNLYARAEERRELVKIIKDHGRIINREVQLRRKSEDIISAQYSAELITLGDETFLQVMVTDISEQKRIEIELRKSEEMYRSLFENMLNGFAYCRMIYDRRTPQDFIYLSVNEAFEKQTGLKDVVGKQVSEVIPGIRESDPGLFEVYGRVALTGNPEELEIYVEALEQWYWISVYSPAREHFVAVFDDITERKQAEEELKRKNAEIEQFIYTVSHDLRSPLVTVKTFMGYLEKDMLGDNQEQLAQDIQYIHGAADKMKMLLDELLELSRVGRIETTSVSVALSEVLAEAQAALAGVINERTVDIRFSDTDLMLIGDRPRLCQIWQNLIENAIKYCRADCIPRIELGVQQERGETVFFVKDNGIGIDPQYHSKVFGIFEKLNPGSPGAGMGLALVQRIVEKCDGRIWVESEGSGKGSCFFFTLPQAVVQS